jgi:hypothetical protein
VCAAGQCFLEHLHFGLDTLTDLLQHANTTCNSPLLSTLLSLLCTTLSPQQQQQHAAVGSSSSNALLSAAALGRLAAAVAAVLPAVSPEEAAAAAAGGRAGAELQPTPELQQSYELSCRYVALSPCGGGVQLLSILAQAQSNCRGCNWGQKHCTQIAG